MLRRPGPTVLAARGFVTRQADFRRWAENREPAPADGRVDVPTPWWPAEDEIDEQVLAGYA